MDNKLLDMDGSSIERIIVCIPFSHYNERAKWALDLSGLPYRQVSTMPLFHLRAVGKYQKLAGVKGKADASSSSSSTPFLLVRDRKAKTAFGFADSGDIIKFADATAPRPIWFDTPEANRFMAKMHDSLGPALRMLCYNELLPQFQTYAQCALRNDVGWLQRVVWILIWPLVRVIFTQVFGLTKERCARAEGKVRAIFAEASEMLTAQEARLSGAKTSGATDHGAHGHGAQQPTVYLVGDRFSAVDLTFASLGGLLVGIGPEDGWGGVIVPRGSSGQAAPGTRQPVWVPNPRDFGSPKLQKLVQDLRESKAGQHILRMYREERGAVMITPAA